MLTIERGMKLADEKTLPAEPTAASTAAKAGGKPGGPPKVVRGRDAGRTVISMYNVGLDGCAPADVSGWVGGNNATHMHPHEDVLYSRVAHRSCHLQFRYANHSRQSAHQSAPQSAPQSAQSAPRSAPQSAQSALQSAHRSGPPDLRRGRAQPARKRMCPRLCR